MELTEWREELAGVLGEHGWSNWECSCGHDADRGVEFAQSEDEHLADVVLASPAMARLLAEVRAEALREAAKEAEERGDIGKDGGYEAWEWLRDRADRIARTNAHPTDDHAGEAK